MVPLYRILLYMGFLMFCCMAQEDEDHEVDSFQSFLETLTNADDYPVDGLMMDEPVAESRQNTEVGQCMPNQFCAAIEYDYQGFYTGASVPPCKKCIRHVEGSKHQYGCRVDRLDRRRCKVIKKCAPLSVREKDSPEEGPERWRLPPQDELMQDGNGQTVYELLHCPIYSITRDDNGTRVIVKRKPANVARFRFPYDDATTVILEPLE